MGCYSDSDGLPVPTYQLAVQIHVSARPMYTVYATVWHHSITYPPKLAYKPRQGRMIRHANNNNRCHWRQKHEGVRLGADHSIGSFATAGYSPWKRRRRSRLCDAPKSEAGEDA